MMGRPCLSTESATRRIDMKITEAEVGAIKDWAVHNGVKSMSAAIRALVAIGLDRSAT